MKRVFLLLLFPLLAIADPGPATRWLINEPASLMDIGILRAELWFRHVDPIIVASYKNTRDSKFRVESYVRYEYEDDLIVVQLDVFGSIDKKLRCNDLLIRYGNVAKAHVDRWFAHSGYQSEAQPDELFDAIANRIELRCTALPIEAKKMLESKQVYWTEN